MPTSSPSNCSTCLPGEQVGEGKKSLAYAVVFRSPDKTLSADDSDAIRQAIVAKAADLGAQLRA